MEKKEDAVAVKQGEGNTEKPQETLENLGVSDAEVEKAKQIALDQRKRAEKAEAEKGEIAAQVETLQAEIAKLKTSSMSGAMPIGQVNQEIERLADEHNVDKDFLAKLISTVRTATKAELREELEKEYTPKLNSIEQDRRLEKAEKKFDEVYSKTMSQLEGYEGIVNKDVIRTLAFNPANAKKTLPQIIEETYGSAVQGRKTIESAHPSRDPEVPNFKSPTKDDWDKIEKDPKAREAWSKEAENQIRRYL